MRRGCFITLTLIRSRRGGRLGQSANCLRYLRRGGVYSWVAINNVWRITPCTVIYRRHVAELSRGQAKFTNRPGAAAVFAGCLAIRPSHRSLSLPREERWVLAIKYEPAITKKSVGSTRRYNAIANRPVRSRLLLSVLSLARILLTFSSPRVRIYYLYITYLLSVYCVIYVIRYLLLLPILLRNAAYVISYLVDATSRRRSRFSSTADFLDLIFSRGRRAHVYVYVFRQARNVCLPGSERRWRRMGTDKPTRLIIPSPCPRHGRG